MYVHFTRTKEITPDTVANRDVLALHATWRNMAGDAPAPSADAFDISALKFCAEHIMVLRVVGDDYLYEHYGASIARISGFDMTGRRVSEFDSAVARFFKKGYDIVVDTCAPLHTVHRAKQAATVHSWERCAFPFIDASGAVRLIAVYNRPFALRHEVLQTALDTAHSGVVSLETLRDEDGGLTDFLVTFINREAEKILSADRATVVDRQCRDVFPADAFAKGAPIFEAMRAVAEGHPPIDTLLSFGEMWCRVTVTRTGTGATVTLSDVTDIKHANDALEAEIEQRRKLEADLRHLANHDPLTGLLNRRAFFERAEGELDRARRDGQPASLVYLDLDHFKKVNDQYGHPIGDLVLRRVADLLRNDTRAYDVVARLGGEEFAILFTGVDQDLASRIAERLRQNVSKEASDVAREGPTATVSVGVATARDGELLSSLVKRADEALYLAKANGRNRVEIAA